MSKRISRGKRAHLIRRCNVLENINAGIRYLIRREDYPGQFVGVGYTRRVLGLRKVRP